MAKYVGLKIGKVHESHVASEYYCGGCGFPVTDHDSFCPECGGAFRECDADDLESENAKLRDELAKWERLADGIDLPEYPVMQFKPKDLERENAKLRELVAKSHACKTDEGCCEDCYQDEGCCPIEREMRELGIEVKQ